MSIFVLTNFALGGFGGVAGSKSKKSSRLGFTRHDRKNLKELRLSDRAVKAKPPVQQPASQEGFMTKARRGTLFGKTDMKAKIEKFENHRWDELVLSKDMCENTRPIVVFVNTKSGGQQGVEVIGQMQELLHKVQVVDLKKEPPDEALQWWGTTGVHFRVLVCGGDGTVGWVLGVLEKLQLEYTPPVAILPLGTGNDLARVMGWGGGFTGGSIEPVLRSVGSAHVALLDRWQVTCRDLANKKPAPRSSIVQLSDFGDFGRRIMKKLPTAKFVDSRERKSMVLCNYFGIGVDAAVALDFHNMREKSPHLFVSRAVNKIWYAKSGAKSTVGKFLGNSSIRDKISVYVDGVEIELPDDLEGVIVLNIASFGGGTDLWGPDRNVQEDDEGNDSDSDGSEQSGGSASPISAGASTRRLSQFSCRPEVSTRPSMQDKKLEVVGVHGAAHIGAAQFGLYTAERLAQGTSVRIETNVEIPVEVDGEPWVFAKDGEVVIAHKSQAFMLQKSKESNHAVATDIVDWALQKGHINMEQRTIMMTEIARRVQVHQTQSSANQTGVLG